MWTYFPIDLNLIFLETYCLLVKLLRDNISQDKKEALFIENLMIWDMLLDI